MWINRGKGTFASKAWGGCGPEGNRTPDLLNAIQALYQLSYEPVVQLRITNEELRIENSFMLRP
jgi:hypothetical protein